MNPRKTLWIVAALGVALGVAAQAAPPARDTCFARSNVDGFTAPNDHTVYLRVSMRDIYRLDLMGDCLGLSWRQSFGLEDRPASAWICSPLEATVVFRENGILRRCPVTAIHRLTPEEIKALPKRDRP